jgi:hypothetical protein
MHMTLEEAAEWFNQAGTVDRQEFLTLVGAYPVSEQTWYIHPGHKPVHVPEESRIHDDVVIRLERLEQMLGAQGKVPWIDSMLNKIRSLEVQHQTIVGLGNLLTAARDDIEDLKAKLRDNTREEVRIAGPH